MNKINAILHKKLSISDTVAFNATAPVQNGGKVKICTIADISAGFTEGQNALAGTMNAVHGSDRCRF